MNRFSPQEPDDPKHAPAGAPRKRASRGRKAGAGAAKGAAKDPAKKPAPKAREVRVEGLLGIGFDGSDGHTRITKGQDFFLVGGSPETHEQMQDFTIHLTERLRKRGKRIKDATVEELRDLTHDL